MTEDRRNGPKERTISLVHNIGGIQNGDNCIFCNHEIEVDGFCFQVNTKDGGPVCCDCAKAKAPDLYEAWKEAHEWNTDLINEFYNKGVEDGKREAAEAILNVMNERTDDRIRRICKNKFNAFKDAIPF